jgi:hypothetical protein
MLSASQALRSIIDDMKHLKAREAHESALSTNKPWISASQTKIKRDAPSQTGLEGDSPETFFSLSEQTLHAVAEVLKARRIRMDQGSHTLKAPLGSAEWEARRRGVLSETNVSPVEIAFLFGYASDKPVRELRIRHGRDEHTGAPLKDSQRPIISDRKRARR